MSDPTYSEAERCSHCNSPMIKGGTKHGQGTYCRTCVRRHMQGSSASGYWYYNHNCKHCRSSGVIPGFEKLLG